MNIKFSVIICAYNASNRIIGPLEHICKLNYPTELFELIVVDNNSTDNTSEIVIDTLKKANVRFDFRLITEKTQGLISARLAGIRSAKNDYLVFVDDDNLLNPDYLSKAALLLIERTNIGALGGQIDLKTDLEALPAWFYSYANAYAVGTQAQYSGDVSRRGYLWGAGIIIKKSLLIVPIESGISFALSGRKGTKLTSGDDSEMCKWVLISGHTLYYSSDLKLTHVIPSSRITKAYVDNLLKALTDSGSVLNTYDLWLWRRESRKFALKNPMRWISSEIRFILKSNNISRNVVKVINQLNKAYVKSSL